MKATTVYRQEIPYPNAATRRQILHRVLDLALMGAIGAGLAAAFLFVLALA